MSALVLGTVGLSACGTSTDSTVAAEATASAFWQQLPEAPLSPRTHSVTAWTGTEALFLGGETGSICPANADCMRGPDLATDGAAYNPTTGTWRRVAEAPVALAGPLRPAVLGDEVFLIAERERALLAYDASRDQWTRHGQVPEWARYTFPMPTGDGCFILDGGADGGDGRLDRLYDPRTREWSDMPAAPTGLGGSHRYTPTPAGLVLTAAVKSSRVDRPDVVGAAVLDLDKGTWRRLPDGDQIGDAFIWTGTRLVAPQLGGVDGGEVNNFGRMYPYGGTLDPVTGAWGRLPNAPEESSGGWSVSAQGARWTAAGGWIYDDADGSWTRLPRPPGSLLQPGAAVWADDRLITFGGSGALSGEAGFPGLSKTAWIHDPAGS